MSYIGETALLILSNSVALVPGIWALVKKYAWEGFSLCALSFISALWHACSSTAIGFCLFPASFLDQMDYFLILVTAFVLTLFIIRAKEGFAKTLIILVYTFVVGLLIVLFDYPVVPIVASFLGVFSAITIFVYTISNYHKYDELFLMFGFIPFIVSIVFYILGNFAESQIAYVAYHALWHAFCALSILLFMISRERGR